MTEYKPLKVLSFKPRKTILNTQPLSCWEYFNRKRHTFLILVDVEVLTFLSARVIKR